MNRNNVEGRIESDLKQIGHIDGGLLPADMPLRAALVARVKVCREFLDTPGTMFSPPQICGLCSTFFQWGYDDDQSLTSMCAKCNKRIGAHLAECNARDEYLRRVALGALEMNYVKPQP